MLLRKFLAALVFGLVPTLALAQAVPLQGGPWVAGHAPMYTNSGGAQPIIQDSGTAAGGAAGVGLSELGITVRGTGTPPYADAGTGPNGENVCLYDAPITNATGYHSLCLSPNAQGGGLISYGASGSATQLPLQFLVNGTLQSQATIGTYVSGAVNCFDTGSEAIVACPNTTGTGNVAYSNGSSLTGNAISGSTITGGTISGLGTPLGVADGGTGVGSYSALRTAMGLGTMALQNATAVAITGGTITGLPSPSVGSDAANKTYVDGVGAGIHPLAASRLITIAALPTNTYSNGALGVGATLTATTNGALSIDSTVVVAGNTVVVNNEVAPANNGIYTVTTVGTGGTPYVLTRATYFDTAAEMLQNSYTSIFAGSTEVGTSWILSANVTTVGTTAVTFTLFTSSPLNSLPNTTIFVGNSSGVATSQTVSGDATLSNTGVLTVTKTNGVSFAASATTDATVATNITSGTLPAARLPTPTSGTLGGVESFDAVSNQFLTSISTSGVPQAAQPDFSNLSGSVGPTQGGTGQTTYATGDMIYATGADTLGKLTAGAANTSLIVSGGIPTWAGQPGPVQRTFTSSGSYTPTSGTRRVEVLMSGGGGGGGGADTTDSDSASGGGGGGGGAACRFTVLASSLTIPLTITIGAGGGGGTTGGTGSNGGTTSFGSVATCGGGSGGRGVSENNYGGGDGGAGGSSSSVPSGGSTEAGAGGSNGGGIDGASEVANDAWGGAGGNGGIGGGGARGRWRDGTDGSATGYDAAGKGGGGGGGVSLNGPSGTGGDGVAGTVIIYEFF